MDKIDTALRNVIKQAKLNKNDLKRAVVDIYGGAENETLTLLDYANSSGKKNINKIVTFFNKTYGDPLIIDKQQYELVKTFDKLTGELGVRNTQDALNITTFSSLYKTKPTPEHMAMFVNASKEHLHLWDDDKIDAYVQYFRKVVGVEFIDFPDGFVSKATEIDTKSREYYNEMFYMGDLRSEIFMAVGPKNRTTMTLFQDYGGELQEFKVYDQICRQVFQNNSYGNYDVDAIKRGMDVIRENLKYVLNDGDIAKVTGIYPYFAAYYKHGWDADLSDVDSKASMIEDQIKKKSMEYKERLSSDGSGVSRATMMYEFNKHLKDWTDGSDLLGQVKHAVMSCVETVMRGTRHHDFLNEFKMTQDMLHRFYYLEQDDITHEFTRLTGMLAIMVFKNDVPITAYENVMSNANTYTDSQYKELINLINSMPAIHQKTYTEMMLSSMAPLSLQGFAKFIRDTGNQEMMQTMLAYSKKARIAPMNFADILRGGSQ